MTKITEAVEEIHKFVSKFTASSPLHIGDNSRTYSSGYRYFHALLIWREALGAAKRSKPNGDAVLQFDELLSDLSYAQFLALAGMYKPARMMLRSSIENMLRVAALENGLSTVGAKFTFELITVVRASKIGDDRSPVKNDLNGIIDLYTKLCAYTHASERSYLSLRVPFNDLSNFDQREFDNIIADYRLICQKFNRVCYYIYHPQLRNIPHKLSDYILDATPKGLKRSIST